MAPKERADSLIALFLKRYEATDSCFGKCDDINLCDGTGHGCGMWVIYAKDSAIICVEQILEWERLNFGQETTATKYWKDVLEHIIIHK